MSDRKRAASSISSVASVAAAATGARAFRLSDFYHGELRPEYLADLLIKNGDFLVRQSSQSVNVLSVLWANKIRNFQPDYDGSSYSFNPATYTIHFFLALLFTSSEKNAEKLGIKGAYWRFDSTNKNLEMFIVCDKDNKKILILKRINFDEKKTQQKRHQWSDESLKSVVSYLNDINQDMSTFTVESHWYDVIMENMPQEKDIATSPFTFFTLDIKETVNVEAKIIRNGLKIKKKFRTIFHKVSSDKGNEIFSNKEMLNNLKSFDGSEVEKGADDLLKSIVKLFKQNLYESLTRELKSYRTDSQCGFAHGVILSLQRTLKWKIIVDHTYRVDNPGMRIQVTKNLDKSLDDLKYGWPLQIEIWPSLDIVNPYDEYNVQLPLTQHKPTELSFNTLNPQYVFSSLNMNGKGDHYKVAIGQNLKPSQNLINSARIKAAINLEIPFVKQLHDLDNFLQSEFMYASKIYRPFNKGAKLNYVSRYLHGYLVADGAAKLGVAFSIQKNYPDDIENKYLKTFMIKTNLDTKDLIINVFEKDKMELDEPEHIEQLLRRRKYPRTNDLVTHSVILNFIVSPMSVNRPEYSTFVIPLIKITMKSTSPIPTDEWSVQKIEFFDLIQELDNTKSISSEEKYWEDKKALRKISTALTERFSYISNDNEMRAVLDGMLHKVKTVNGLVYMRKNVHQVAFLDTNNKLNVINYAHGPSSATALADVQDLFHSGVIDGFQDVKILNLAMMQEDHSEQRIQIKAVPNSILAVLAHCTKFRSKRSVLCPAADLERVSKFVNADENVISTKRTYLENLGKVANGIMSGLMVKDFVSELIRGDYAGMAMNAGFLISNVLTSKLVKKLMSKSVALAEESRTLLASALKMSSPFLRRCPSFAFVGFDLYKSIMAYKNHEPEALVSVGADSAYIALDLAETAIEISEAFGVIEGISAVTGPIGWTLGATLLLGTEIYKSVKTVQRIDHVIRLTRTERFTEGIRSFFGMDPEKHVKNLMKQKRSFAATVANMTAFLQQQPFLKRYIFPIALNETGLNVTNIDLRTVREMKITRAVPVLSPDFRYFCMPSLADDYSDSTTVSLRHCHNSIGLENNLGIDKNISYIQLPDGYGIVWGIKNESNIFDMTGSGLKTIEGGSADDIFLIRNQHVRGFLHGGLGQNLMDFSAMQGDIQIGIAYQSVIFDGLLIHSNTDNRSLSLNRHSIRNNSSGTYSIDVVYSNTHGRIFQSTASELLYILENDENEQIPSKVILMKEEIHQRIVVDFQEISPKENQLSFDSFPVDNDIVIQMTSSSMSNEIPYVSASLILANAMKHELYRNVIIRSKTIMTLNVQSDTVKLVDNPLFFGKDKNLIVVSPRDNIEYRSIIHFDRILKNYDYFQMNQTHLLITNALWMNMNLQNDDYFTLIMIDFFTNNLLQSLKLGFGNGVLNLEDGRFSIENCRSIDYLWQRLSSINLSS
uniref:SH2 domain-containing protein n=1 Tax=Romanomermis culicivorax TaxID=13658 RepID=A0A915IS46_ROMCU